jgi:hypothetical protein
VEGFIVTDIQPGLGQLVPVAADLAMPVKIGAALPEAVRAELAAMPAAKQDAFLKAYQTQSRSLLLAYLTSLIYCHYGLLGRWAMTGMMFLSLFIAATLGWIWWLIDLVRMPEMVRAHNHRVAAEIMRGLNAPSDPAALAGS